MGNGPWDIVVQEFADWATIMNAGDHLLLGYDNHTDRDKIWNSYHDHSGHFDRFIRTGVAYTNRVLGVDWYRDKDWVLTGEIHENPLRHRFVLTAVRDVSFPERRIDFKVNDRMETYEAYRYTREQIKKQFPSPDLLEEIGEWKSPDGDICKFCRNFKRLLMAMFGIIFR
jgi:uncharacterized SAM-dependent methyltransferase